MGKMGLGRMGVPGENGFPGDKGVPGEVEKVAQLLCSGKVLHWGSAGWGEVSVEILVPHALCPSQKQP